MRLSAAVFLCVYTVPVRSARGRMLFSVGRLYLVQIQLDGGFPAEHGDHNPDLAAVQVNLIHSAQEGLQAPSVILTVSPTW